MNRALRRVSLACLAMFVLLLVNVNYVQGFEASSLANEPGNGRTFNPQFQYQRGSIITADQKVIAYSSMNKAAGELPAALPVRRDVRAGHRVSTRYSARPAIEQAEDKQLSGTDPALAVHNLIDLITGKPKKGATVELTINSAAQQAAYNALKASGKQGGVVALNPQTGAILALASYPSFDPNLLATLDGTQLNKNDEPLLNDPNQPLLNRAINVTFPPGSTFKIVTSSTAFSTGKYTQNTRVFAPTQLHAARRQPAADQLRRRGVRRRQQPQRNGTVPLIYAFTVSCNTVFGNLGMKLGGTQAAGARPTSSA